jgi:hypothetical protein
LISGDIVENYILHAKRTATLTPEKRIVSRKVKHTPKKPIKHFPLLAKPCQALSCQVHLRFAKSSGRYPHKTNWEKAAKRLAFVSQMDLPRAV